MVTLRLTKEELQILIVLAVEAIEYREGPEIKLPHDEQEHLILKKLRIARARATGTPFEEADHGH